MSDQVLATLSDLFPDQVILDILTRLPAKTISRFRTVSKTWNSFIIEPHFFTTHLSRNPPTWFNLDRFVRYSNDPSDTHPIRFVPSPHCGVFQLDVNPNTVLKPDKPESDPDRFPVAEVLYTSNGLVLFAVNIDPDPFDESLDIQEWQKTYELFIASPTTGEWSRLPSPPQYTPWSFGVVLVTRPGPVREFVVGALEYDRDTGGCTLICYGSETGKWVRKDMGNNPMNSAHLLFRCMFEYQGKMCWSDSNVGVVIWEEDPFVGCVNEKKADCRFIPLPLGRAREDEFGYTVDALNKRCIDVAGEWIQYMEMFPEGEIALEVWRLKDWKEGEWESVYKVPKLVLNDYLSRGNRLSFGPKIACVDPFDPNVVIIHGKDYMVSLDVRNRVVKSCSSFMAYTFAVPCVVPSWPPSLPPRMYAEYKKEQANAFFKGKNFMEAVKCYSRSIASSSSIAAYANRAMAYINLGRFCEAEQDCNEVLNVDDKHFKVYWRRSLARERLSKLEGALEDVAFALKLQPDNKQMKKRYDELKCLVDKMCLAEGESGH